MTSINNLYSARVMDHFLHPRNMGELPEANGIATVGNKQCGDVMRMFIKVGKQNDKEIIEDAKFQTLGCLPSQEKIVLPGGQWLPINELKLGTKLLNGERKETLNSCPFTNEYHGEVLTIVPFVSPFNSFTVTPNHPIFSIKRKSLKNTRRSSSKCDWLRVDKNELFSTCPDYIRADKLQKSDYLVFPYDDEVIDKKFFTKKFMRLLGYYLSEGYITAESVVNFSFNRHEKTLIKEVKSLVFEITGKTTSERTRKNVTEIRFCSKKWADFFYLHGSKLARNKSLSQTILKLPFRKQWEMITTFILGDGNIYRRRPKNTGTYRMITVSNSLAIQIQEILARGGIYASIREIFKTNCYIDGRKLKDSIQYLVSFKLKKTKNILVHKCEKYFLVPIRELKRSKYGGLVYNLQVLGEPNSYLARGFIVHNCGAAIATSSIATEMIKGKPVSEALKLTKQAIMEALGGLPPAKHHCSVLAAEAVKKAIEDYKNKKLT